MTDSSSGELNGPSAAGSAGSDGASTGVSPSQNSTFELKHDETFAIHLHPLSYQGHGISQNMQITNMPMLTTFSLNTLETHMSANTTENKCED